VWEADIIVFIVEIGEGAVKIAGVKFASKL